MEKCVRDAVSPENTRIAELELNSDIVHIGTTAPFLQMKAPSTLVHAASSKFHGHIERAKSHFRLESNALLSKNWTLGEWHKSGTINQQEHTAAILMKFHRSPVYHWNSELPTNIWQEQATCVRCRHLGVLEVLRKRKLEIVDIKNYRHNVIPCVSISKALNPLMRDYSTGFLQTNHIAKTVDTKYLMFLIQKLR